MSPAAASPLRLYYSAFRIRLLNNLQYRIAALAGLATQFFWGFMMIMILLAFYRSSDAAPPMTPAQTACYIWLQQAFLVFVALWYRDMDLFGLITSGNVAYELCRPTSLYWLWYVRLLAQRMAGGALRCLPVLLAAFLLPRPYGLVLPPSLAAGLLFLVTLTLGLFVNVGISMFIYILTFRTLSPVGSLLLIGTAGEFCAGLILPLPLMPDWLQKILLFLPFRLASDLPFRTWSGHLSIQAAEQGVLWQLAWLIVLTLTGKLAMDRTLRRLVVQGG
jgi:ABC-2 type transport system permease protein